MNCKDKIIKQIVESSHWKRKNTIKNILKYSVSSDIYKAFYEWETDYSYQDDEHPCDFCGEDSTTHRIRVINNITGDVKMVGGICAYKYSGTRINGTLLSLEDAEKYYRKRRTQFENGIDLEFSSEKINRLANWLVSFGENRKRWREGYDFIEEHHGLEFKKEVAERAKILWKNRR